MTIGQFAEIITMAYLGFFLKRLGFHKVISIGIAAYCVRYAIFGTESFPVWVMVISQAFHGFCYAFFFAAAYIYVDKIAELIILLIKNNAVGVYNVGTEKKTMYELAKLTNKNVSKTTEKFHSSSPDDVTMDTEKKIKFLDSE